VRAAAKRCRPAGGFRNRKSLNRVQSFGALVALELLLMTIQ
jgi:hypothetical protein